MDKVLFSSEKMDWETPGWLFGALDKIFGFELDAAAGANNAKCKKYYSLECSGLENPPRTRRIKGAGRKENSIRKTNY